MELRVPVIDDGGAAIGALVIAELPRGTRLSTPTGLSVAEGGTYRFAVELDADTTEVVLEPDTELFSFDDGSRLKGRFEPRQHVGRVRVRVLAPESGLAGTAELEVAPTKLEYATEYQQMVGDVAEVATAALLQGFSPAALALRKSSTPSSRLLYQQFAFLHARLSSAELRNAFALISASPHRDWRSETELVGAGRPIRASAQLGRALLKPGSRVDTHGRLRVGTVPKRIERSRTEATYDSVPNRFVRYALERWRTVAQALHDGLERPDSQQRSGPLRRGVQASREVIEQLDQLLAAPFFREVGRLEVFPSANQVLHKQEGYRQIFQTFALAEVGANLSLDWDLDDVFSASQRNVATLYEYWAFLQLVDVVGDVCGTARTVEALALASDGLSLGFKQGVAGGVKWETHVGDRDLEIEVFFNRTFTTSTKRLSDSSWSRMMRPDCSMRVRPQSKLPQVEDGALDVWLHFDAKYRVERVTEQFDSGFAEPESAAADAEITEGLSRSKREDLLKMHAYRDAIRRSAGAYVLFPGNHEAAPFREFTEPLPGLGAFVLRPRSGGRPAGWHVLRDFLTEVVGHVADQASQHERDRYWRAIVRSAPADSDRKGRELPELGSPPRDEHVLCVELTNAEHLAWVIKTGTLALGSAAGKNAPRIDADELRAEWLLLQAESGPLSLWRRASAWSVQLGDDLQQLGHPDPVDRMALVTQVIRSDQTLEWLTGFGVQQPVRGRDADVLGRLVTWADLLDH